MKDLRDQLRVCCRGRLCLVGVGHAQGGDDAFGVSLVEALAACAKGSAKVERAEGRLDQRLQDAGPPGATWSGQPRVTLLVAGCSPERHVGWLLDRSFDHVVFADAADFGGAPGSVALLNAGEAVSRLPQVSTHRFSLGLLASMVEGNGRTRAWVLGSQPHSLHPGKSLGRELQSTTDALVSLMAEILGWADERHGSVACDSDARPPVCATLGREVPC